MRKILFRGKDKDNKCWYEGGYVKLSDTTYCFTEDYDRARREGRDPEHHYIIFEQMTDWGLPNRHLRAEVMPDTVCECTGMPDINQKWIFERDILRVTNSAYPDDPDNLYLVIYQNGAFVAAQGDMFTPLGAFNENCKMEVIGNAIDNQDMLKQIPCFTPEDFFRKLEKEIRGHA